MTFEIMGQKENWLTFAKEGSGIELKGNIMYGNFDIQSIHVCDVRVRSLKCNQV